MPSSTVTERTALPPDCPSVTVRAPPFAKPFVLTCTAGTAAKLDPD
ncbi:hypothetical protein ACFPN0_08930 [Kitasatospora cinereorecta]